ncbi:uncharacterized protein VTP21DRAFT_1125 [Calcarisporiella thermophila]|uniref:uncharacterized protein n=1 Tax=Calcarisporiella thermophila TaxID=911321 RepID=UPI003742CD50
MAFKDVVVAGGTGVLGSYIVDALAKSGKFQSITVLTRADKPELHNLRSRGIQVHVVDYNDIDLLTEILRGKDAVVSALPSQNVYDQLPLAKAAKKAGVVRFIPSEYGMDTSHPDNSSVAVLGKKDQFAKEIEAIGLEYTRVMTGFWPDYLILYTPIIDVKNHTISLVGKGETLISWTHRRDVANGIVGILSNPEASRNQVVRFQGDRKTLRQFADELEKHYGTQFQVLQANFGENLQFLLRALEDGHADLVKTNDRIHNDVYIQGPLLTIADTIQDLSR